LQNFLEKSSEKSSDINQNCTLISKILKILKKLYKVWVKNPVFGSKSFEKLRKVLTQGFAKIRKFQKLFYSKLLKITKKDVKLKLRKSQKTRSDLKTDSKTDSKVRLKVLLSLHIIFV